MVADDDAGMRLLLKKIVEKTPGFEAPVEVKDGLEALELFERYRPRLVFLDIEMPLQRGVECARRIQDIDPRAFIVFVTAHEEYMREAFELYAMDYLVKPFKAVSYTHLLFARAVRCGRGGFLFHPRAGGSRKAVRPGGHHPEWEAGRPG